MAKPLLAADTIFAAALDILDSQGREGLNARNLAAQLQCSTRTLYQQVGKRDELIRQLLDYHFARSKLEFEQSATWQASAQAWAEAMRSAFLAHPNLSRMLTIANRQSIADYVTQLLKVLLDKEFDEELALRSCRVLTHLVISLSLAEIETPPISERRRRRRREEIAFEDLVIAHSSSRSKDTFQDTPEVFSNAISWCIKGIEAEWLSATTVR